MATTAKILPGAERRVDQVPGLILNCRGQFNPALGTAAAGGGGGGLAANAACVALPLYQPAAGPPPRTGEDYALRRSALEAYFDRTALDAWKQLTSDAPVSRIRATVRAGRTRMRDTLLGWLPEDMTGLRLLDAGCGTGALAVEAARRGAAVVAIDVAAGLVDIARQRAPAGLAIDWRVGDMRESSLGRFDHVVAMDSLIHYAQGDIVEVIDTLAPRTAGTILFTFAPQTRALMAMHAVGRLFPRANRAPAIEPVAERRLRQAIGSARIGRDARIASGFYTSHALEVLGA